MAKRQNIVCSSEMFYLLRIKSSPPIYLRRKAWSGRIMERAVTSDQRNQRISYEMRSQWNQLVISRG